MPDVSVVIGVFNGAAHLATALESVLSQEGVSLEIIIVDDGSTDATPAILSEYAARDARVRVIHQEHAGLTMALIRGCDAARGGFIARQDADDVSLPGRLAKQAGMLVHDPSLSFVSCWSQMIGPGGEILGTHRPAPDAGAATQALMGARSGPPGHGTVMMRRESYRQVGGYRPVFYYAQDSDLWLRLGAVGQLAYVPEVLYRYAVSENSISGGMQDHKVAYMRLLDECFAARQAGRDDAGIIASFIPDPPDRPRRKSSAGATLYFIGRCLLAQRHPAAAGYFRRCLARNPMNLAAWVSLLMALPYALLAKWGRTGKGSLKSP